MDVITPFKAFLKDSDADTLYITGVAGTGKTTCLGEILQWCLDNGIETVTTAYTHKACGVLRNKLPPKAHVATLHSFLKKRPTINGEAVKRSQVDGNSQHSIPDKVNILFIDEFSMVGEKDFVCINDIQYDEEGEIVTKVVYIGDPNQLPPVKDAKAVIPSGPHWIKLTQIHRQASGNPLIDTLLKLNDFINGESPEPLTEHSNFIRGQDIVQLYKEDVKDKILLAYTNMQVQTLNAEVQGYEIPLLGDAVFSPTLREYYTLIAKDHAIDAIVNIRGDILEIGSKYKTLEKLHKIPGIEFFTVMDEKGNEAPRAVVFGHANYLAIQDELAESAVAINKRIAAKHNVSPNTWAKANWMEPLAKERGKAWGDYLAFKENVICVDFVHAMTVHKSQGSTYENVYLDTEDMGRCANSDYSMYLKLLYVAISRASGKVYTN